MSRFGTRHRPGGEVQGPDVGAKHLGRLGRVDPRDRPTLAALHSPRAARLFADLADAAGIARATVGLIAISEAAAEAAGEGWRAKAVAPAPRDEALLALAANLCKNEGAATSVGR